MNIKAIFRTLLILAILTSNIGCDQVAKEIIRENINYGQQISVIDNFLTLTKTENKGAFLGVGSSLPKELRVFILAVLPLIVLGLSLVFLISKKNLSHLMVFGIGFMIGGGIGNIYDRIVHGSVTDFLHIDFVIFQTGIFNMADVSILVGGFFILCESYLKKTESNCRITDRQ